MTAFALILALDGRPGGPRACMAADRLGAVTQALAILTAAVGRRATSVATVDVFEDQEPVGAWLFHGETGDLSWTSRTTPPAPPRHPQIVRSLPGR